LKWGTWLAERLQELALKDPKTGERWQGHAATEKMINDGADEGNRAGINGKGACWGPRLCKPRASHVAAYHPAEL